MKERIYYFFASIPHRVHAGLAVFFALFCLYVLFTGHPDASPIFGIIAIFFISIARFFQKQQKQQPSVFTYPQGVVTYRIVNLGRFNRSGGEQKLAEILKSLPTANLYKHQKALGIRILDVQRKGTAKPKRGSAWV